MPQPIAACCLLLTCLLAAQAPAPAIVPVAEEPAHHLVFENEYVRVFQVEVAPHTATLMHRHDRDYVFVTLGDSEVISERQGEKPVTLKLQDGETRFTKGGFAHIARNLSDKPFRNVTVEILRSAGTFICGAGQGVCSGAAGATTEGGSVSGWNEVVKSDVFAVRQFVLGAGRALQKPEHKGPHLVIAITNLRLQNELEGQQLVEINQSRGDIKWVPGGFTHSVTNIATEPARFVTVEFK